MKPKIQNTKYKILPFRKLAPGLVLLSFVLSGILAPVSVSNKNYSSVEIKIVLAEDPTNPGDSGAFLVAEEQIAKNREAELLKQGKTEVEAEKQAASEQQTVRDKLRGREVKSPFSCGFLGDSNLLGCVGQVIWGLIYIPSTYIIALAGWLFDITLAFTLSTKILNLDFARDGWVVTRDLANMFFIFILLYIAIATILEIAAYNAKALLARLIIVALLLNFSLFFTRVVIDASNILALAFYDRISTGSKEWERGSLSKFLEIKDSDGKPFFNVAPKGISAGLAAAFNPQKLAGSDERGAKVIAEFAKDAPGKLIFIFLFSSAILLTAAWAFFSVAFLFITRTAILWFLMATAPIAFAAIILPKTREIFTKWWGELISKSFCVAVFLFFLWLITKFAETSFLKSFSLIGDGGLAGGLGGLKGLSGTAAEQGFVIVMLIILLQFLVLLIMILVAKQQTQKMCGAVAGFSMNMVSGLGTKAAGLLVGGVGGFALRNTLGAYAFKKSDEWNKAGYGGGGLGARLALQAARKVAGASFDVKATKLGKTAEFGEAGGKGGYSGWVKDRTAKDVAFARSFGVGQKADDAREAFAKELAKMGTAKVFSMGTFGRMITGRGVLSKVQPEKAAKEVGKMAAIGRRIREGEENVMREAADAAMREEAVEYDTKGGKKKYNNMKEVDLDIAGGILEKSDREKIVNAAVSGIEKHAKTWADTLDDKKAELAPLIGSRSPKDRADAVTLTKEIGTLNRNLGALKEHRRLEDKKAREGRTEEKPGATSSSGGASGGTKTP